jgi:hypothetical protein
MWKEKFIKIGKPLQSRLMSPNMFHTIAHKVIFLWIIFLSFTLLWIIFLRLDHESIYLSMNLGTSHLLRFRVGHRDTFHEVCGVFSECMVKREELSMLVERRELATLLQPNEL